MLLVSEEQKTILKNLGVQQWWLRSEANVMSHASIAPAVSEIAPSVDALKKTIAQCTACGLDKSRTQTVFGVGNVNADVMIIGEAPGKHEDLQGEPFVGRAGQLLNQMLLSIGFKREDVFIANILKCRPPNNRDPLPEEVKQCTPFLLKQIALIQPKVICAVGRIAAQFLLDTQQSLGKCRGRVHQYGDMKVPLIVTYHPAYLLRNPSGKRQAYQDLLLLKRIATS